MTYTISPDRRTLTVTANDAERAELRELGEEIGQDRHLFDAFERLLGNSPLDWIAPAETGDLTDAPILGIRDWGNGEGNTHTVLERWGFMGYAIRSPLHDLRDTGAAVFVAP